jgi:hypothetical protein
MLIRLIRISPRRGTSLWLVCLSLLVSCAQMARAVALMQGNRTGPMTVEQGTDM